MPDEEYGEIVTVVVVPDGELTADDVIAFCREHLVGYKCPARVELVDELPRDPMGKIRKRDLRTLLLNASFASSGVYGLPTPKRLWGVSEALDDHGHALAAADAHRLEAVAAVGVLEAVEQRGHDARRRSCRTGGRARCRRRAR